ncbi:MAG: hypothetical protein ABIV50_05185 [Opitutus sp.]
MATPFRDGVNAAYWPRTLGGNFVEIVDRLAVSGGITTLEEHDLRGLSLSAAGRAALDVLMEDQARLRAHGLAPSLDCIADYSRSESDALVPTDVYSFHADSATVETDTYLCSYTEAASEGLRNEDARRYVDVPEVRTRLLKEFGGADNASFTEYLAEQCFNLHYEALPATRPYSFGLGNLWRIAVDYPNSLVPPCIHRAPQTTPGQRPRLLLIS